MSLVTVYSIPHHKV